MRHYITSDLHLHDDDQPFLFTDGKEEIFVQMAEEIRVSGSQLILAGDVLDLTGLQPPALGLDEFFAKVLPAEIAVPTRVPTRSVTARMRAVQERFPRFFRALQPLAKEGRLHMIPGNHDFELTTDEGRSALATALDIPAGTAILHPTYRTGDFLVTAHGHEFDPSNQTTHGVENRGAIITRALYHGLMPAMRALGIGGAVAIPAVRPEENVVTGLEHLLAMEDVHAVLVAFVELLRINGYFAGFAEVAASIATHLVTGLLSPQAVRERLADDTALAADTKRAAEEVLSGKRTLDGVGVPLPKVLIFGHTHERDGSRNYVNLATWIDHVTTLKKADLDDPDRTLPVVVINGDNATQYNVQRLRELGTVDRCPVLWGYAP